MLPLRALYLINSHRNNTIFSYQNACSAIFCWKQDNALFIKMAYLWMMALKARPSLHDLVKSLTWTLGYRCVVFWAHRKRASLAETSSCPTTISEIWKKKETNLEFHSFLQFFKMFWSFKIVQRKLVNGLSKTIKPLDFTSQ